MSHMLYYLFKYLDEQFDFPGAGLFQYLSFRALMAATISLLVAAIFGKYIILFLRKKQIGETIRNLGLQGQMEKKGTPTMGGIMIIAAILLPVLLVTRLDNIYIILLIITTLWMGFIGFLDDYIKIFRKNKEGLQAKFKLAGQITLGIGVGLALYFHPSVVVRKMVMPSEQAAPVERPVYRDQHSTSATIPFLKNNELEYAKLLPEPLRPYTWLLYVAVVTFIITAISNGANITDGIDGLAAGTSAIIGTTLGVLAYVSGNLIFSNYLNIMYLPNTGEVLVFCTAFVGACIGFLWYNSYPAQVFMGDTGSLPIGAIIAVIAIMLRKELLIPVLCGIFIVENLSVVMQVAYFKYTKKKYGEGRRIFLMSPLHHHYQKKQIPEPKIVTRFWIVGILLAIFTIATLKIR